MSHAFAGCSGLSGILSELEGKADTVPSTKPMAKKLSQLANRKKAAVAKAAAKAAAAKAAAPGKAAAKAPAAKAAVPGKAPPVAKAFFLAPTAKCAAAPAKAAAKAPAAKCAAAPAKAAAKAPAAKAAAKAPAAKNMSRKCVHSRAYKAAAKIAKEEGLDAAQVSEAACAAGKAAALQWDEQFGAESNSDG